MGPLLPLPSPCNMLACRKDSVQPAGRHPRAGERQGGDRRGSRPPALADLERQGQGCADNSRAHPPGHAGLPGRTGRPEKGSAVTPAVDRAARDRSLSHQPKCLAGQLCRAPSSWSASRHFDHRRHRQLPGQPPHEQIAADAMVAPRRRSPAPGPVRRLQRQARFQLRPAVPGRRSRLRARHGGLTPNRSAVPIGKTTLSRNIGVAAALHGLRVATLDLDPQRSLTLWYGKRPDELAEIAHFQAGMVPEDIREALAGIDGYDLLVIDTPPSIEDYPEVFKMLIVATDLAIIPTGQSSDDI